MFKGFYKVFHSNRAISIALMIIFAIALFFLITNNAVAASVTTEVFDVNGKSVGTIVFEDSEKGLVIKPALSGLPSGSHGFHIHEHADCGHKGMDAGEHLDPMKTKKHLGPYANGHLGDLPVLEVAQDGLAKNEMLAPRLKVKDIQGHAIMIHAGGDNYSDNPKLGGGGDRIACGVLSQVRD